RTTAVGTPDRSARAAASQSRSETNAATRYEVSGSSARSRMLWARLPAPEANSTIGRRAPGSVPRTPPLLPVDSWPPGVPGRCSVVESAAARVPSRVSLPLAATLVGRVGLVGVDTGARLLGPLGGGGFAGLHTWLRAIGVLRVVRVGRIASGVGLVLVVLVVLVVPLVIAVVLVGAVVRSHLLPVSVARGLLRLVVELGGGVLSPVSLVVSVVSIGARPAVATVTVVVHVLRLRC